MEYQDLKDGQHGVYMIARPWKLYPVKIDEIEDNGLIVKIGRSTNLKKRLETYLQYGYHEDEIACYEMSNEEETRIHEKYFKDLFKRMSISDKHYGHEWFVFDSITRNQYDTLSKSDAIHERKIVSNLFEAMRASDKGSSFFMYEAALAFGIKLPGMKISRGSICDLLSIYHKLTYEFFEEKFKDCAAFMADYRHLHGILDAMCQENVLYRHDEVYILKKYQRDYIGPILDLSHHLEF